jgi:hypothetical protein
MEEVWKRVPGYTRYEVNNVGLVRSYIKNPGKGIFTASLPQRILYQHINKQGYKYVALTSDEGKRKNWGGS